MKSKPPAKKVKLEGISGLDNLPSSSGGRAASPAGSTASSTVSSLLSIPPPNAGGSATVNKLQQPVSSGLLNNADGASSTKGLGGVLYPTYTYSDLQEFSRLNMLLSMANNKGSGGDGSQQAEGGASSSASSSGGSGLAGLSMEDIEQLQGELETLWSTLAVRIRTLKVDQANLTHASAGGNSTAGGILGEHYDPHHQEKINAVASLIDAGHGTRTSVSAAAKLVMGSQAIGPGGSSLLGNVGGGGSVAASSTSAGKKSGANVGAGGTTSRLDKLPKKKLKGEAGGASKKGGEKPARATQNRSHSVSSDFGVLDGFLKHEAPSEFWEYADNFCKDLTPSNVTELKKIVEDHGSLPDNIFETPSLGKHFRGEESAKSTRQRETRSSKSVDACGPLTQRLVSALVEERIAMHQSHRGGGGMGSPREEGSAGSSAATPSSSSGDQVFIHHRAGLIKALGLDGGANRPSMESQLRECLLDRGLLRTEDANDSSLFNPEDEIACEIRKTQNTLRRLHQYNSDKLRDLYSKATRELERATYKKDLEKADKDVLEAYKTIASLKMKKKPVTKKEKEAATKAIENREKVLKKINPRSSQPQSVGEPLSVNIALKVEV